MNTTDTHEFDLDELAAELTRLGLPAGVDHTGGGVATLYAGWSIPDPDLGSRRQLIAGPGYFAEPGLQAARGSFDEFCYGPDDYYVTDPTYVTEPMTIQQLAQVMYDWAMTQPRPERTDIPNRQGNTVPTLTCGQLAKYLATFPDDMPVTIEAGCVGVDWLNIDGATDPYATDEPSVILFAADDFDTRQW